MTFHTLLGPSDPRVLSGILAKNTLAHLKRPQDEVPEPAAMCILNFIRLVDMYRYGVMQTEPESMGIFESEPFDLEQDEFEAGDPLEDIKRAMDVAREQVFNGMSRKKVGACLHQTLLWHLEDPDERDPKSDEDDSKARRFLKVFIQALPDE